MATIIAIAAVIAVIIANQPRDGKRIKEQKIYDPELARAMTYDQVTEGEEATESPYVNFDVFFLRDLDGDGNAEGVRGTCKQVGTQDRLYMELAVNKNGYLKDGKITINSNNFYLETVIPKENETGIVKENAIGTNTKEILLRDVTNGSQKLLEGFVKSGEYTRISQKTLALGQDASALSQENSITLTGIHVSDDGTETPIEKTVNFNVDWYGTVETEFPEYLGVYGKRYKNQEQSITSIIDEENRKINMTIEILTKEQKSELTLSKSGIEVEIPQLNEYNPTKVSVNNAECEYDDETRILTAKKEIKKDENEKVISNAYTDVDQYGYRYNKYTLQIEYPYESYETMRTSNIQMILPVKAYYEGINNPNEEFTNPYISETVEDVVIVNFITPSGTLARVYTNIGEYMPYPQYRYIISKDKTLEIYNGLEEDDEPDTYEVEWFATVGSDGASEGMTLKENEEDAFIKKDGTQEPMGDATKNIGIYFQQADDLLGEEGWIKVYDDETDELIHTFTKEDWGKYSSKNPYKYEMPVKQVRVETSATIPAKTTYVMLIKELDNEYITEHYTKEEFDNISYIKSTVSQYLDGELINTDINQASYEQSISIANIYLEKSSITTQTTEKDYQIVITASANERYNQKKWLNGSFLLKMPDEIINLEVNNIVVNNRNVKVSGYDVYEENGSRFIKILTENETPEEYSITINCEITADPRIGTITREIQLYADNERCRNYEKSGNDIYDVNGNKNTGELVNTSEAWINLVSPNTLLTNQLAKEYDTDGSTAIAPQVALVSKEQRTATIELEIKNNYSSTISEIKVLGKIPTEGNTYAITKKDMESNFSATMVEGGIVVPEGLREYTKVYYSEKENTTKNLEDEENEWIETPTDWTKIKSYLIVIQNYTMQRGIAHQFTYQIEIPEGLDYNQVSYSHHGVYFSLDTEEGKYQTQLEPNKLGIMISKQYDVEIIKYQKDTNKAIEGATYTIIEENQEKGNTKTTNEFGKLEVKNLFAERTYVIKEIKSPSQYALNEEEIKFKTKITEDDELEAVLISGTLRKGTNLVVNKTETGYTVSVQLEDEVRPSIKIIKQEKDSDLRLPKVKYRVTGKGLPTLGRALTTNINGETTLVGLYVDEEYTLTEISSEGYYLASPIKFTISNNGGEYSINIIEGETKETSTIVEDEIPTLVVTIENEKIPRYDIEITKVEKENESKKLAGAKFKLYKDNVEVRRFETDENGKILIENLYQYEEEKGIEQTYVLKETLSPEGYAKIKDVTFKVYKGEDGNLIFDEKLQTGASEKIYTSTENKINLIVEDSPSFKLIKTDGETGEVLPNTKFAIYNVENGTDQLALDSKYNILGTKEIINGREYYTLTTNEKGEITADLREGLYKAVEVQASHEKYDITDNVYYFGIGVSRETLEDALFTDATSYGIVGNIAKTIPTSDGGMVAVGSFTDDFVEIAGKKLVNVSGTNSNNNKYSDGLIIKYNENGQAEWADSIGGMLSDVIGDVIELSDGNFAVRINTTMSILLPLSDLSTMSETDEEIPEIIVYSIDGTRLWSKTGTNIGDDFAEKEDLWKILGTDKEETEANGLMLKHDININILSIKESNNEGYLASGYANGIVRLQSNIDHTTLKETEFSSYVILKYDTDGNIIRSKMIPDIFPSHFAETTDGGLVVVENAEELTEMVSDDTGTGMDSTIYKYDNEGTLLWTKKIQGEFDENVNVIEPTKDGGIIVGGDFCSGVVDLDGTEEHKLVLYGGDTTEENTDEAESRGITSPSLSKIYSDGMVVKYDKDGNIEWTETISGQNDERVTSIEVTSENEYVVGGIFCSSKINIRDKVLLASSTEFSNYIKNNILSQAGNNSMLTVTEQSTTPATERLGGLNPSQVGGLSQKSAKNNGMLIKFAENGTVKWARAVTGDGTVGIDSVIEIGKGVYKASGVYAGKEWAGSYDIESDSTNMLGNIVENSSSGEADIRDTDITTEIASGYAFNRASDNSDGLAITEKTREKIYTLAGMTVTIEEGDVANPMTTRLETLNSQEPSEFRCVAATDDGGYIVAGVFTDETLKIGDQEIRNNSETFKYTDSDGNEKDRYYADAVLIKYDSNNQVEWVKSFGGEKFEGIEYVSVTSDGGYLIQASYRSPSLQIEDFTVYSGSENSIVIVKYDNKGNVQRVNTITGDNYITVNSREKTKDNGIIVVGQFLGKSINISGKRFNNNGSADAFIVKYSENGELEWVDCVGSAVSDTFYSAVELNDGNIIVGGMSYSTDSNFQIGNYEIGAVNYNEDANNSAIVVKYSASGEILKAYREYDRNIDNLHKTNDGGIINAVTKRNVNEMETSDTICNVSKYNSNYELQWEKQILGNCILNVEDITETNTGEYIIAITPRKISRTEMQYVQIDEYIFESNNINGYEDGILVKLNSKGRIIWAKQISGENNDYFYTATEIADGRCIAVGGTWSGTLESDGKLINNDKKVQIAMLAEITNYENVQETSEITAENYRKEFNIKTAVDGTGGTITGSEKVTYETVKYGENSTKEIFIKPYKDYEILKITVNGQEQAFEANEDGSYIMPIFENMTEDKKIVVTFILKSNKITINKIDEDTKEPLEGAEVELTLKEIDVTDDVTDAPIYTVRYWDIDGETLINEVYVNKGEIITLQDYSNTEFVGWRTTKEFNTEVYTSGNIYVVNNNIDFYAVVNFTITWNVVHGKWEDNSSTFTEKLPVGAPINYPTGTPDQGFGNGTWDSDSTVMHANDMTITLTFFPDETLEPENPDPVDPIDPTPDPDPIDPTPVPNPTNLELLSNDSDIEMYSLSANTEPKTNINKFIKENGVYKSQNQGHGNTTALAYIPIDLTQHTGTFNLTINASISSEEGVDIGYIKSTTTDLSEFNFNTLRRNTNLVVDRTTTTIATISGEITDEDYTIELTGGMVCNLIFAYKKNAAIDAGEDTFTINSVKLTPKESTKIFVQTGSEGKAITQIPFGTYTLKETQAPEGYEKLENAIEIKFTSDPVNRIVTENENGITAEVIGNGEYLIGNKKLGQITVHHYLKDREGKLTEIKLAEDQILEGKMGESYKTEPYINIDKYELQKDEYGQYIIPEDYEGIYELREKEINYYYEEKQIPLIVHHYIENTTIPVSLVTGEYAQDVEQSNYEGEIYTTTAIPNEELANEYELAEVPTETEGTYSGEKVELTYYYKKVERNVNLLKYKEDGQTPLEGAKFTITKTDEIPEEDIEPTIYTTDEKGKITVALEVGEYKITEIEAPAEYELPENPSVNITITRETTEENLEITNEKIKGTVIVHHYIKGLDTPVKLSNGTYAEDETKQGYIGTTYATKAKTNIAEEYEYDSVEGPTSGEYIDGTLTVTYYYKALVDIDVVKKWNHTNNIYGKPQSIIIELYADGEKIKEAEITESNKVTVEGELEDEETWKYTFEKLPKYTDGGNEINYTISEKQD